MKLPWVSRAQLEASENLRQHDQRQLVASEALRQQLALNLEEMRAVLAAHKSEAEQERRKLMDRICRLSGQPPLYETPAVEAAPAAAEPIDPKALARVLPKARVTFDDIHNAAKTAMENGNFNPDKGRIRA